MKQASTELIALLQTTTQFVMADCFTFTLLTGQQLYYTTADVPVTVGSTVFQANALRVSGLKYKISTGVDVDEQDITMIAGPTDTVNGVPWMEALRQGILDGAYIQRDRAFLSAWNQPAVESVTLFHGRVSTLDKFGRTTAQGKVKSDLVLLSNNAPKNLYQPDCLWTLYGVGCGVPRAAHTVNGSCQAGSTVNVIVWSAETEGVYDQGTLIFTSGPNAGTQVTIKSTDDAGNMTLVYPLESAPGVGDTFTVSAGCDHTMGAGGCAKFNNLANFRGYPYVPQPYTAT
jgi:uncharacterized phage protein (TIGR02218 family)